MDTIFNYLYPKYNKDRNYVIVYLLPKIEKKIMELESIIKTKNSAELQESLKSKKIILLSLRYYFNI